MSETKKIWKSFPTTALWLQKSFPKAMTPGGDIGQKQ
jgi:hypothetical protein